MYGSSEVYAIRAQDCLKVSGINSRAWSASCSMGHMKPQFDSQRSINASLILTPYLTSLDEDFFHTQDLLLSHHQSTRETLLLETSSAMMDCLRHTIAVVSNVPLPLLLLFCLTTFIGVCVLVRNLLSWLRDNLTNCGAGLCWTIYRRANTETTYYSRENI